MTFLWLLLLLHHCGGGAFSTSDAQGARADSPSACVAHSHGGCVLEGPTRLSESALLGKMRQYYDTKGPAAWGDGGAVPFRITSTSHIARNYAEMVLAFWDDSRANCSSSSSSSSNADTPASPAAAALPPLYVVELGAGHGTFSLLCVSWLERLLGERERGAASAAGGGVPRPDIRYVVTDFAAANLRTLRRHPQLGDGGVFAQRTRSRAARATAAAAAAAAARGGAGGVAAAAAAAAQAEDEEAEDEEGEDDWEEVVSPTVDFAQFDGERDSTLPLQLDTAVGVLSPGSLGRGSSTCGGEPVLQVIAIANYLLDTLSTDAFRLVAPAPGGSGSGSGSAELREVLVSTVSERAEESVADSASDDVLERLRMATDSEGVWSSRKLDAAAAAAYYDADADPLLSRLLPAYAAGTFAPGQSAAFELPRGGLRAVRALRALGAPGRASGQQPFVLLASDKGRWQQSDFHVASPSSEYQPFVAQHGSISFTVNFHAVARYFELAGGGAWRPGFPSHTIDTFVFGTPRELLGGGGGGCEGRRPGRGRKGRARKAARRRCGAVARPSAARSAYERGLALLGPGDIVDLELPGGPNATAQQLLTLLRAKSFEPGDLVAHSARLREAMVATQHAEPGIFEGLLSSAKVAVDLSMAKPVAQQPPHEGAAWRDGAPAAHERFENDAAYALATALYYVDLFHEAELYYQLWNGPVENVAYNIGLCHFYRGAEMLPRALAHFRLALYLMPLFGSSMDTNVLAQAGTSVEQLAAEAAEAVKALEAGQDAAAGGAAALLGTPLPLLYDARFHHGVRAVRLLPAPGAPVDRRSSVAVGLEDRGGDVSGEDGSSTDWAGHDDLGSELQHFVLEAGDERADCPTDGVPPGAVAEGAATVATDHVRGRWRVLWRPGAGTGTE